MEILKDPSEYAKKVKALGFTKEQFCESLIEYKLPRKYIMDCLLAW